jgi:uncharacterized delta-60 repeat protein
VVAGTASSGIDQATEFALARFLPTGQLDTAFGNGGLVTTSIGGVFPMATAVIVQPDGKILVGGSAGSGLRNVPSPTVLVRYNSNGSLDNTFGDAGIVSVPTAILAPAAMAQLSSGSYLAVSGASAVEFNPTGALQSTITSGTLVTSNLSGSGTTLFQPNGDFVVAEVGGVGRRGSDSQVFRFSETAVVDPSFLSTPFMFGGNTQNFPQAIALQSNGAMVVGGLTNDHGTPVTGGLARIGANGALDAAFSDGGIVTPFTVSALLVQMDGNIVAVGNSAGNLALARYLGN